MKIAYINRMISLPQIGDEGYEVNGIQKQYTLGPFANGKYPQSIEEDAERQLITDAQPGDVVYTSSMVNFSRQIDGLIYTIQPLIQNGVRIVSLSDKFDSESDEGRMFIQCFYYIKRFQADARIVHRANLYKGIQTAQKTGKYVERSYNYKDFPEFDELARQLKGREITKRYMSTVLKISRPTLDRLLAQYDAEQPGRS